MSTRHYKTFAKWLERLALAVVVSLVIQKIFTGASLDDPVVVTGVLMSLLLYALAAHLLLKS